MSHEFLVPTGTNDCSSSLSFTSTLEKPSKLKGGIRENELTYSIIALLELIDYVLPGASTLEALTIVLLGILRT